MTDNWFRAALAEVVGTFALVFVGVLSISGVSIVGAQGTVATLASIALAHGLVLGVMIAALGAVSGGHFNPAVTFGFIVTGRINPLLGLLYWIAQLAGASVAGLLVVALFGAAPVSAGTPDLGTNVGFLPGVVAEAVGAFFLVLVVFGTAVDERAPKSVFPLAIGLTLAAGIMALGPLTGGSLNPARTFGPALASGHWANHLVYWIGPLIGGALAALLEHHVFIARAPVIPAAGLGGPTREEERRSG